MGKPSRTWKHSSRNKCCQRKAYLTSSRNGNIQAGTNVAKGKPIFPRLEIEKEAESIKNLMTSTIPKEEVTESDSKDEILYDDFMKLDLRVAEVIHAEKMKNADKLLKLQ